MWIHFHANIKKEKIFQKEKKFSSRTKLKSMKRNKIWNWVGINMSSIFNLKNYFSLLLYSFNSRWSCWWWSHRWMRKWGSEINKLSKNSFNFFLCSDHRWAAVDFLIVHTLDDDLFYYFFFIFWWTQKKPLNYFFCLLRVSWPADITHNFFH